MEEKSHENNGVVVIYSNKVEKISPLLKKLETDNINIHLEHCSECASNLDTCILSTLDKYSPDIIIIDNNENNNGITLYETIKAEGATDYIPVVLLGVIDEELRLKVLELGAIDLIDNPLSEETHKRIKNYIEIGKRITTTNPYDRLTGTYTRIYAENLIKKNIEIANEEKTSLIVMLVEIKNICKFYEGIKKKKRDEGLSNSSNIFKKYLDSKEFIYRYSSDKFVLVFLRKTVQHVLEVGKRLQEDVNDLAQSFGINISFSAGISALNTETCNYCNLIEDASLSQSLAKEDEEVRIYIHDNINTTKKDKHILVIDSDTVLTNILSVRYKNKGYRVSTVEYVENSIPLFESGGVDLLIMEFEPFTSLQKYFKSNALTFKNTKILVLTSSKSESVLESALKNGADEFIQKPFSIVELDLKLQKLI